jgi:UrcA family protein
MNSITKLILAATAAAGALVSVGAANAATIVDGKPTAEISTRGINLKTPEGQARLMRLTRSAARQVCFVDHSGDLSIAMQEKKCFNRAMAQAVLQIATLRNSSTQVALSDAR